MTDSPPDPELPAGAVAVIFTSVLSDDTAGYDAAAQQMDALAARQPCFLGMRSVRDSGSGVGIGVSYWTDEDAARNWKNNGEHLLAQRHGRERWYAMYRVEVCRVLRAYGTAPAAGVREGVDERPTPT